MISQTQHSRKLHNFYRTYTLLTHFHKSIHVFVFKNYQGLIKLKTGQLRSKSKYDVEEWK